MKKPLMLLLAIGVFVAIAVIPFLKDSISPEYYRVRDARNRVNSCLEANINGAYPTLKRIDVETSECMTNGYCSFTVNITNDRDGHVRAVIDPRAERIFLDKNSRPIPLESDSALTVFGDNIERIDRGISECFSDSIHSIKEIIRRALSKHH